jgi:hypothetical protein
MQGWTGRPTLSTTSYPPGVPVCYCFFPAADKVAAEFSRQLASSFKSAVVLGNNKDNIHLIVSCKTLEEFDAETKSFGSVNVWADVGGMAAAQCAWFPWDSDVAGSFPFRRFGVRPNLEVVDIADILSGTGGKRRYAHQTLSGVFFALDGKIVRSPALQPKFQTVMLTHVKVLVFSLSV